MEFDAAVDAAKAGELARVKALMEAEPDLLVHRDDLDHSVFDHALWALLVGDYSRPPRIAPDDDGS